LRINEWGRGRGNRSRPSESCICAARLRRDGARLLHYRGVAPVWFGLENNKTGLLAWNAMSAVRRQAQIDAPIQSVWNLVGDPNRHPEWFPKVVEAECDGLDERCTYRMVVNGPVGI
jgi:hypothetical protein